MVLGNRLSGILPIDGLDCFQVLGSFSQAVFQTEPAKKGGYQAGLHARLRSGVAKRKQKKKKQAKKREEGC